VFYFHTWNRCWSPFNPYLRISLGILLWSIFRWKYLDSCSLTLLRMLQGVLQRVDLNSRRSNCLTVQYIRAVERPERGSSSPALVGLAPPPCPSPLATPPLTRCFRPIWLLVPSRGALCSLIPHHMCMSFPRRFVRLSLALCSSSRGPSWAFAPWLGRYSLPEENFEKCWRHSWIFLIPFFYYY